MQVLKNFVFLIIGAVVLALVFTSGVFIAGILVVLGLILSVLSVIHIAAYLIKDYWSTRDS